MAIITESTFLFSCSDIVRQMESPLTLNDRGTWDYSVSFKGYYDGLFAFSQTLNRGDVLWFQNMAASPLIVQACQVRKLHGTRGLITFSGPPAVIDSTGAVPTVNQKLLKDVWSLKSVRADRSILCYCGSSEGANARREDIEAWQKEPDPSVALENKYTNSAGQKISLNEPAIKIVNKIRAGIDSVIRFYPMIVRKRNYTLQPNTMLEHLCEIDPPPVPQTVNNTTGQPIKLGLYKVVGDYSWLKIQDDCDESQDGTWLRIESWIGVSTAERSWDVNLYGTGADRWSMPLNG